MKATRKLLYLCMALLAFTACKKDNKGTKGEDDPFEATYSNLTIDQNKENVENAALDMVNQMDDLEGANALQVLFHMQELMDDGSGKIASHPVMEPLKLLASMNQKKINTGDVYTVLKSTSEDPANLSELWEQVKAQYTWNSNTNSFDSAGSADALIIEFPGMEADLSNTATLTISGLELFEVTDPREDWPSELAELPKGVQMSLMYNGNKIMSAEFSGSYNADGMPTALSGILTIEDFKFSLSIKHTPCQNASVTYNLKRGSSLIMEIYFNGTGDWSETSLEENVITTYDTNYTYEWDEGSGQWIQVVDYIEEGTEPEIEEIIQNANAHVVFMNIKIAGTINFKKLGDVIREIDEDELINEADASDALVEALNENAKLVVVYLDENKKIAETEAYTYNDEGDFYPMFRFVYADGTKIDASTYLENELENFFDQLNALIEDINTDYGIEIDPVDPSAR